MNSVELRAPAKVNLLLKIVGKRKDSYHNILTIFERISLFDKIKITKIHKGISVSSDKFITSDPKDNIVYKAAALILEHAEVKSGVSINIKKNIPIAGGLAGGSTDAAAVLIGINRLFGLGISKKVLMKMGSRLGADVPFFLFDVPFAVGRQKGDRLEAIKSKQGFWHLLINPGFHLSTKDAYQSYDFALAHRQGSGSSADYLSKCLTTKSGGVKIHSPFEESMDTSTLLSIPSTLLGMVREMVSLPNHHPERCRRMDFSTAESMLHNDLQDVVIYKKGIIGKIIERLATLLGKKAIVSGSGPSVFCLCKTRKEALGAKTIFLRSMSEREKKLWRVFVARTC